MALESFLDNYRSVQSCFEILQSRSEDDCKGVCKPCHDQCYQSCSGPTNTIGDNGCTACKNVKDGSICIPKCPDKKYPDVKLECKTCHENCDGCTGPTNKLGQNGCDKCKNKQHGSNCVKICPANTYDVNGICKGKEYENI